MTPGHLGLLAAGGVVAGAVNAVAGGGSLVSFPALLAFGYPALSANVTNTVALWPGYAGAAGGYRRDLAGQRRRGLLLVLPAAAGAGLGVVALLEAPGSVFRVVVPYLVLVSAGLLAAAPRVAAWMDRRGTSGGGKRGLPLRAALAALGVYFGAGLGVALLGVLALFLPEQIQRLNALKTVLSLVINTIALGACAALAPVAWVAVAVVAPASLAGGFLGAKAARVLPAAALRWTVVALGLAVGAVLLARS